MRIREWEEDRDAQKQEKFAWYILGLLNFLQYFEVEIITYFREVLQARISMKHLVSTVMARIFF